MAKTTEDQVVDMKKALEQCMDDADMLEELLVVMVEEMSVKLKVIGKAVVSNKHADVWKAAHAIKGAALTLAINPLGNAAKNLEEVGRAIDEAYKAQNTKLDSLIARRGPSIKKLMHEATRFINFVEARKKKKKVI